MRSTGNNTSAQPVNFGIMNAVWKSLVLLLALAAPIAVHSQCTFCPDGIENPGAEVQGGLITCEEANSL